jgi:hypothetical protein
VVRRARTSEEPVLLIAAALFDRTLFRAATPDLMARAAACAASTRDRQLLAIGAAHLAGETERLEALAREHLVDFPDNVLVSWMVATSASVPRSSR